MTQQKIPGSHGKEPGWIELGMGYMSVRDAGHKGGETGGHTGGQRTRELIEEGKPAEGHGDSRK